MADDSIVLLKNWTPEKMQFPAMLQRKWDGIPTRIRNIGGHIIPFTRDNERLRSIPHIVEEVRPYLNQVGSSIVMELIVPDLTFRKAGGIIRRQTPDADTARIVGRVFDADITAQPELCYAERLKIAMMITTQLQYVETVLSFHVNSAEEAEQRYDEFMLHNPDWEGMVCHSDRTPFKPGKRDWGTQRLKPKPTIDLRVHSFEEAISKPGEPLGMVGRINVYYKHKQGKKVLPTVGVGPGKFTHEERSDLWSKHGAATDPDVPLLEVQYMLDEDYDALRQPTAQRWRPDKKEPDHA